jgi:hypothetical protein
VADGTPVDTFYNGRCDAGWYIEAFVVRRYVAGEFVTFAVARLPTPGRPIEQGGYPAGDYLVVMEDGRAPTGEPRGAIVAGGGVVALFTGCGVSPRQFLDDKVHAYSASTVARQFLLPPR